MEEIKLSFSDVIFKEVLKEKNMLLKLHQFVEKNINKKIKDLKVLDSCYLEENNKIFSIHMLLEFKGGSLWLIFAFGEKRSYIKENYYWQTNRGRKLYLLQPAIRYNMNKICEYYEKDKLDLKKYGFILELFSSLLDNS